MQNWFLNVAMFLWDVLLVFWLLSALKTKRTAKRQSIASRLGQSAPVVLAFFLLFARMRWPWWLTERFVPHSPMIGWIGVLVTAAGIGFAIWARVFIGRNWSGTVTVKEQHELIQTGPYGIVRHPIYSGFMLAFMGTAIVEGEVRGLVGFVLVFLGWWMKLRLEENFMAQQFGSAYAEYKQRVKALVPFVV